MMNVEIKAIKALEAFQIAVDDNFDLDDALIKAHDLTLEVLNKAHGLSIDASVLAALEAFDQAMFVDGKVEREHALYDALNMAIVAWVKYTVKK